MYVPTPTREAIPADLLAEPAVGPQPDIGAALAARCEIIAEYRLRTCALANWSEGGPGVCPPPRAADIGRACE